MGAILLGNGLNRCIADYPSWDSLLTSIGREFFSPVLDMANPLLKYDVMLCDAYREYGSKGVDFRLGQLLNKLNIEELSSDDASFLASILDSGVKTVLTTNYDYNLENALFHAVGSPYLYEEPRGVYQYENIASDKRYTQIGDMEIHHIHGELNYYRSICLGITKYVDNLTKTVELLSRGKNQVPGINLQKSIAEEVFCQSGWRQTWAELLFNTNIYIVGLGLSESELDLWWLLMRRSQLLSYDNLRSKINNQIYYFLLSTDDFPVDASNLKALGIKIKPLTVINDDWRDAYRNVWKDIRRLEKNGALSVGDLDLP